METFLDDRKSYYWRMARSRYHDYKLDIWLAASVAGSMQPVFIDEVDLGVASPLIPSPDGLGAHIHFGCVLLHMIVDESYALVGSQGFEDDPSVLAVTQNSKLLELLPAFMLANGNKTIIGDEFHHYRLVTSDEIVHVISSRPPVLKKFSL